MFKGYKTMTWSIRDKTTTGFTVYAREALGVAQALRMDLTITEQGVLL